VGGRIPTGLYIHVPFCVQRCSYCDFNTYAGLERLQPAYGKAVLRELARRLEHFPELAWRTLYLGGGTPSRMPVEAVAAWIAGARADGRLAAEAEITLEANPGTLDWERLQAWQRAGVNRLSLGVQSTHDAELEMLGRIHTWAAAVTAVQESRAAGFDNLSLDLIYGLPGQTLAGWEESVARVLALEPEHLSLYALTLEEETPLAQAIIAGVYPEPDEELAAMMYERASELLMQAGFWQYEISNWARGVVPAPGLWALPPGGSCEGIGATIAHHNLIYWRNEPWVGLGAGAHSWAGGRRWNNLLHPGDYIAAVQAGELPDAEGEVIPPDLEMGETMMLGLRLVEGVSAGRFQQRFGRSLEQIYGPVLQRFQRLGLIEWDGERVRLTVQGRLVGNQVFAEFLP